MGVPEESGPVQVSECGHCVYEGEGLSCSYESRSEEEEKKDIKAYHKKAGNLHKKKQILTSYYQ